MLINMKEVVVGVLTRGDKVLACQRRSNARYPLKWEFPGGKIEKGESPSQALARELHEELDIQAHVGPEFFRQEWIYPDGVANPEKDGAFKVFYHYIHSFTGTPLNRVFEQIRWVNLAELEALDILEGNREAVAFLVKHGIQTQ
jgi:8-oxo-dGTP diphosphatase